MQLKMTRSFPNLGRFLVDAIPFIFILYFVPFFIRHSIALIPFSLIEHALGLGSTDRGI